MTDSYVLAIEPGIEQAIVDDPIAALDQYVAAEVGALPEELFELLGLLAKDVDLAALSKHSTQPIASAAGNDGPWIFAVPDRLTHELSLLVDRDTDRIAAEWWPKTGCYGSTEAAREDLGVLVETAREAMTDGRALVLLAMT